MENAKLFKELPRKILDVVLGVREVGVLIPLIGPFWLIVLLAKDSEPFINK